MVWPVFLQDILTFGPRKRLKVAKGKRRLLPWAAAALTTMPNQEEFRALLWASWTSTEISTVSLSLTEDTKESQRWRQPGLPTSAATLAVGLGPFPISLQGISAAAYAQ